MKGSSLIEILMGLLILGLILGISSPFVYDYSRSLRFRNFSELLAADLRSIALKAQQRGVPIVFKVFDDRYLAGISATPYKLLLNRIIPPDINLNLVSAGEITFHPGGVSSPATITVVGGDRRCDITLALRGRVKSSCI